MVTLWIDEQRCDIAPISTIPIAPTNCASMQASSKKAATLRCVCLQKRLSPSAARTSAL